MDRAYRSARRLDLNPSIYQFLPGPAIGGDGNATAKSK
ncbi:MAG: hypothetical protein AVDCRST_MAG23-1656 [uncultured Sphingosinicella sp.]|uniref:Uncharacterized protein n=1 Tax=uncultured Sphingosinicella sp. TaxID=478748 RepID=A0A6J4U1P9_9SPHN|nr:MAG: hypothetical protein AVDCRST_MAG23-1656 [uncultured Sphingosinicella sp.]